MSETTEYIHLFDDTIKALFSDAVRITLWDPSVAAFFVRMRRAQRMAEHRRSCKGSLSRGTTLMSAPCCSPVVSR